MPVDSLIFSQFLLYSEQNMADTTPQLKYHILTFGCQMNKNDSERVESLLRGLNMTTTPAPEDADVILMNSCSVRQKAEDRIYGMARNFAQLKEKNPNLIICVTGCMPGRDKDGSMREKLDRKSTRLNSSHSSISYA